MTVESTSKRTQKICKKTSAVPTSVVLILFLSGGGYAEELGPFIRNYELLSYETQQPSNDSVRRFKRAADEWSGAARVRFKALGREFRLLLHPDLSSFSDDFVMTTATGAVDVDLSHIVSGHVEGDPGSRVLGSVVDGVFHGRISIGNGSVFYAEPAWMYPLLQNKGHTVFYSAKDVHWPSQLGPHGGCGLDKLQAYPHKQNDTLGARSGSPHFEQPPLKTLAYPWRRPFQDGRKRRVRRSPDYADPPPGGRRKPQSRSGRRTSSRKDPTRRVCHMQIVVDHMLYDFFAKDTDDKVAHERITSMVGTHMASANIIYSATDFQGIVGMRFVIQDLRVNDTSACEGGEAANNPFCRNDLDANLMLELFASEERNDFCLSYAWTNRDLGEGTLGLAYLAYASDKLGGACEKFRSVNTREGIRRMALNTGVITLYLHGGPVALAVSEVTVAHEIGHSLGALLTRSPSAATTCARKTKTVTVGTTRETAATCAATRARIRSVLPAARCVPTLSAARLLEAAAAQTATTSGQISAAQRRMNATMLPSADILH
ncbi:disintegrin and metalloproteinase domain-containing protein 10-like isoform X2 [Dermacentor albipictus]|uniref:disintegrin and metalloproteinase domain-containing protein 10-like isoform X2 n=1 Tax=Dermacentor albipictus TaxID=60249 RepID=UPI0038FCCE6D